MATFTFFNKWKEAQLDGELSNTPIDFTTDSIRLALVDSVRAPVAATDEFFGVAISANEVTGTGYTAAGEVLGTVTVTESGGTVTLDAADVTWTQNGAGFSDARYAILYKHNASLPTAPLVGFIDFTADKGNVSGDLTVQWNASGIFTLA